MTPHIIGIAGGSCSGKTTIASGLSDQLGAGCSTLITLDSYYHDLPQMAPEATTNYNFDEPAALDERLLIEQVGALAEGRAADVPVYDHATHTRGGRPKRIEPAPFIIVEGLFALYWPELRALLHTRVFIDAAHETCLDRRIQRDVEQRGRTAEEVADRYRTHVEPMFERHVAPTRAHADMMVDGLRSPEECAAAIVAHLKESRKDIE